RHHAVRPRLDRRGAARGNGERQDEAVVVIGVLADEIDSPWGTPPDCHEDPFSGWETGGPCYIMFESVGTRCHPQEMPVLAHQRQERILAELRRNGAVRVADLT